MYQCVGLYEAAICELFEDRIKLDDNLLILLPVDIILFFYNFMKVISMKKIVFFSGLFVFGLSVYFATVLNLSFWRFLWQHLEVGNVATFVFVLSLPFFMFIPLYWFFNLIIVPYLAKPLTALLLIVSAAVNYAMFKLGIFIDSDMYRNIIETNSREALDLVTLPAVLWVLVTGVLPAALVVASKIEYRPFGQELKTRLFRSFVLLLILAGFAASSYKEYVSFVRNNNQVRRLVNTFGYIYAVGRHYQRQANANRKFVTLDSAPVLMSKGGKKQVMVLVVGETARAANFSLYGYERKTNPELEKRGVMIFGDVSSCGTATAVSLPCMFSHMNRRNFDALDAKYTQNLLDLLQIAGYQVLWRENDDGCKGVCERVTTENMLQHKESGFCKGDYCQDEVLLEGLREHIRNAADRTVIVLHTMGSHGPTYFKRYPDAFKKFVPSCDTADLQNCSREQIVNTYDNTLLYTDYVLASVIDILKEFPSYDTAMMYVSDHGESLGENNIYLHGVPYKIAPDEQKKIPMLLWLSGGMAQSKKIDEACLRRLVGNGRFSHDNIFHSLLGFSDVKTGAYAETYDVFAACRR